MTVTAENGRRPIEESELQRGAPRILVCDPLPRDIFLKPLLAKGYVVDFLDERLSPEDLAEIVGDYDAVVGRSAMKLTRIVIEKMKTGGKIVRAGVGFDNIDVPAATEREILVATCPQGNINAAAEHTVALALAVTKNIPRAHGDLQAGQWKRFEGSEIRGRKLGIIGLGNVGSLVKASMEGMGMKVVVYDPYLSDEEAHERGVQKVSFDQLLKDADIISLHVKLSEETRAMMNQDAFSKMKPTAYLINTSRGEVIDEAALIEALKMGKIGGAALDVFEEEGNGPVIAEKFHEFPNVVTTPHIGASTKEAQELIAIEAANTLIEMFEQGTAKGAVNALALSKV